MDSDPVLGSPIELLSSRNRPLAPVETLEVLVRDDVLVGGAPGRDLDPGDRVSIQGRCGADGHVRVLVHDEIMSDPAG